MAIDYNGARQKVNELNRSAIKIVDMLAILERGSLLDGSLNSGVLTTSQVVGLKSHLENEANNLKALAGGVKDLVKE